MRNQFDDFSIEDLEIIFKLLNEFNHCPKAIRKEILNNLKEKIKFKRLQIDML